MNTDKQAPRDQAKTKSAKKPVSLKSHKLVLALHIRDYISECIEFGEKIDKKTLKDLGEIA